jgi:hypothetical protein
VFEYLLGTLVDVELTTEDKLEQIAIHTDSPVEALTLTPDFIEEAEAISMGYLLEMNKHSSKKSSESMRDSPVSTEGLMKSVDPRLREDYFMLEILQSMDAQGVGVFENIKAIFPQIPWDVILYVFMIHCQRDKADTIQCNI